MEASYEGGCSSGPGGIGGAFGFSILIRSRLRINCILTVTEVRAKLKCDVFMHKIFTSSDM